MICQIESLNYLLQFDVLQPDICVRPEQVLWGAGIKESSQEWLQNGAKCSFPLSLWVAFF